MTDLHEDELLYELDVHVSTKSKHIIQYPLCAQNSSYEKNFGSFSSCEIKPKCKAVRLGFDIKNQEEAYDFKSSPFQVEQFYLQSRKIEVDEQSSYAVGILGDNDQGLTLFPVEGILQMKPDVNYVNEMLKDDFMEHESDSSEEEQVVQTSVKKRGTKVIARAHSSHNNTADTMMIKSGLQIYKAKNDELWASINYDHGDLSTEQRDLPSFEPELPVYLEKDLYNNILTGTNINTTGPSCPSGKVSFDKITHVLKSSQVISFTELCTFFDLIQNDDVQWMLSILTRYCILVHTGGIWIWKSPSEPSHDKYILARDYIILQFYHGKGKLKMSSVYNSIDIELEAFNDIFESLANRWDKGTSLQERYWILKPKVYPNFQEYFTETVSSQRLIMKSFHEDLEGRLNCPILPVNYDTSPQESDLHSNVELFYKTVFTDRGVHKKESLYHQWCTNETVHHLDRSTFEDTLNSYTICIKEDIHCIRSTQNPIFDKQRTSFIKLFADSTGPLRKSTIMNFVKKDLNQVPSEKEYLKIVHELCEYQDNGWILNKGL